MTIANPSVWHGTRVLIVDDVPENLTVLSQTLAPTGCEVLAARSGERALSIAQQAIPDVILLDVMMPILDGFEVCRRLKKNASTAELPVLFVTARDDMESLVKGFTAGGIDYITKPFRTEEVLARVETHLKIRRLTEDLRKKNRELEAEIQRRCAAEEALETTGAELSLFTEREATRWGLSHFIGKSATIRPIVESIRKLLPFQTSVLITGESGTGKELVARAIHSGGPDASQPFIPVNCSAIPQELAESLFFGHVKGAFTGATSDRKGYFELARGGTLFLDEIGEMPLALQAKLLRAIEDQSVTPVGGVQPRLTRTRILAASNIDFPERVRNGRFREDLYFRLARYIVNVPSLRERPDDIALLVAHFLKQISIEMRMTTPSISDEALGVLAAYEFPGNVRELRNIVERALIESGGRTIEPEHLHFFHRSRGSTQERDADVPLESVTPGAALHLPLNLQQAEEQVIKRALEQTRGNIAAAARLLGIHRAKLYRKVKSSPGDGVER